MHETNVTAFAPPLRIDVSMVRTPSGDDDSVTVTVAGASMVTALEHLHPPPWMPWVALVAWQPWLDLMRIMWTPALPLMTAALPFAVTVSARRPGRHRVAPEPPSGGVAGVIVDADYRRVD